MCWRFLGTQDVIDSYELSCSHVFDQLVEWHFELDGILDSRLCLLPGYLPKQPLLGQLCQHTSDGARATPVHNFALPAC